MTNAARTFRMTAFLLASLSLCATATHGQGTPVETQAQAQPQMQSTIDLSKYELTLHRDDVAGIQVMLPQGAVAFDRYEAPFAYFEADDNSGIRLILSSTPSKRGMLPAYYQILQGMDFVPANGPRSLQDDSFTIEGENDQIVSHSYAVDTGEAIKGFTLVWPADDLETRDAVLSRIRNSFTPVEGVMQPDLGHAEVDRDDLANMAHSEHASRSASGVFADASGHVLTTSAVAASCSNLTINDGLPMELANTDGTGSLALLRPTRDIGAVRSAHFSTLDTEPDATVAISGYSYGGRISRPTLTMGETGAADQSSVTLEANTKSGDSGGPVLDQGGAVRGVLLPLDSHSGTSSDRAMIDSPDLIAFLQESGAEPLTIGATRDLHPEDLSRIAERITTLVICRD
ncbi:S1 family peptidase [Qingshengfaniella alkalisoli]|uniref:Trypsin-like peptidase domain-containing protein n=1 Tax=Qingshengfaniella alkalisoli TaxID=2599296 RepID=A0A5B8I8P7_9RHOB|nr:serine protease [Qingshengfaniella alkalisoli]QDY69126.1 trypsin-like peptidase domain-containing protein [Qingshengfaniella alkalisoli]